MKIKFNPLTGKFDYVISTADEITLGEPSDGTYSDGLLDFTEDTVVNDAIDDINEILSEVAPSDAEPLDGKDLTIYGGTTTKYSGYLSDGNVNYKPGDGAGSHVDYIIKDANFNLNSPDQSTCFNKADEGLLKVYINDVQVGSFDLASNFDEDYRDGDQVYPPSTSADGKITVTYVGKYNNFKKWQKGNCRVNITSSDLRQGWSKIKLVHDLSTDQETNDFDVFYDNDTGPNPSVSTPTITEVTKYVKYLSGIQFYTTNSTFYLNVSGMSLFNNVYTYYPIYYSGFTGVSSGYIAWNDSSVSGVSNPPHIGDVMYVQNKLLTITQSNTRSTNARITCRPRDPYGSYTTKTSASENRLVDTYGTTSTNIYEYFDDENRRLPSTYNFESTSDSITGQWDSTQPLTNGNAQVYYGRLYYPTIDFTSGYLPAQQSGVDYSGFSGDQVYYRANYDSDPHNSGILEFGNLTGSDIQQVGQGNVNVEIKLPTQTGWLDLGKPYDAGTFTGADGDGCRTSQTGSQWGWTSGTFTTANSGYRIYIKVTLRNSNKYITQIRELGW